MPSKNSDNNVISEPVQIHASSHLQAAGSHLLQAGRNAAAGVGDAGSAAKAALHDGLAGAGPELSAARQELNQAGGAAVANVTQQWEHLRGRSESFVRERPLAALGLAVAGGYLLSRLLRR